MLTERLPLLEADVVGLERDVLGVVEGGRVALAVVVVVAAGLLAGGHAVGVGGREVAGGGGQVRVRVLLVVVEGVHRGVRVPRRRHARHRLRLVCDLRRAVQAHQQARHQAQRGQLDAGNKKSLRQISTTDLMIGSEKIIKPLFRCIMFRL